jgi:hypothetical protein
MVFMMGFFTIGPFLETSLFPTYGKFKLVTIEPYGNLQSRTVFEIEKRRSRTPAGFAWSNGDMRNSYQLVEFRVEGQSGSAITRPPPGHHTSSPSIIDVPPNNVRTQLLGEIYRRCHPLWITGSEIYP